MRLSSSTIAGDTRDFNPRTREGCDGEDVMELPLFREISIHAPVKGATTILLNILAAYKYFNPRTREGCDQV